MRVLKLGAVVFLFMTLAGCGLLFNDNPQKINISSDPSGARVLVDGQDQGITPVTLSLNPRQSYQVTVEAQGYPAASRMLDSSVSVGVIIGDILFGLIPLVVDLAAERLHQLEPGDMHFQFAPVEVREVEGGFNQGDLKNMMDKQKERTSGNSGFGGEQDSNAGAQTQNSCCINGAYYACPDMAAVNKCAPPELGGCMMNCDMMDMSCPDQCLQSYPPDPSSCSRDTSKDASCQ